MMYCYLHLEHIIYLPLFKHAALGPGFKKMRQDLNTIPK